MVAVWMVDPPVAVTVTAKEPAARAPALGPLGSTPPLPQPLSKPRVMKARNSTRRFQQRRVRRGRKNMKKKPARAARLWEIGDSGREALRTEAAGEMVRIVVSGVGPVGVMEDGVKRQDAPAGRPPVQVKVTVEWKPPMGLTLRVTGLEGLPFGAEVEAVEGVSVKTPTGSRTVRVAEAEVLG